MRVRFDSSSFKKEMDNIVEYSLGFLDGVHSGKKVFLDNLGRATIEGLKNFVDSMARVDPEMLHHVYEWDLSGSPSARLFDVTYTVSNLGLSLKSTFRQSVAIAEGAVEPFYNKARIMEEGIPVTIRPKRSEVLRFIDEDGEEVFTKKPIRVESPGGVATRKGFEQTLDTFITQYFRQSFLRSSGIMERLKDVSVYNRNISQGARSGRSAGIQVGYRWIINAGVIS